MSSPSRDRPLLIYDGDCAFCRGSVEWLHQWVAVEFEAEPYQASDHVGTRSELTEAQCREEVKLLLENDEVVGGVDAFFALLHRRLLWRPISWLARLPLLHGLAERVYRWIARRRRCLRTEDGD